MEDERPMFIPANCLPTNKTSWASSHSASSPKHEIYSAPAFAFVHSSLTTQFTLFLKLSNSSCLPPTSSQLKLCFVLNLAKYSSLKLFRPKKKWLSHILTSFLSYSLLCSHSHGLRLAYHFPSPKKTINSSSKKYLAHLHSSLLISVGSFLKLLQHQFPAFSLQNFLKPFSKSPHHVSLTRCFLRKPPPPLTGKMPLSNNLSKDDTWPSKTLPFGKNKQMQKIVPIWGIQKPIQLVVD